MPAVMDDEAIYRDCVRKTINGAPAGPGQNAVPRPRDPGVRGSGSL
ncbi:hypothetical protein [Nonomuraea rhizosphaerae]|nr:hypothetical protein [Nonomuraea rhizosphaerae]